MKALTLWQPYASAIPAGLKRVETRPPWAKRLAKLVGTDLAIHAAVRKPDLVGLGDWKPAPWRDGWRLEHYARGHPYAPNDVPLPLGAVVAVVRIAAVVPIRGEDARYDTSDGDWIVDTAPWYDGEAGSLRRIRTERWGGSVTGHVDDLADQVPWGDWTPGRVGIVLEDVRALPNPVPMPGAQQLWELNAEALRLVAEQLELDEANAAADRIPPTDGDDW